MMWCRFGLVVVLVLASAIAKGAMPLTVPPVAMEVPKTNLPLLNGGRFVLDARPGKVTVINFWALWCAPCKAEMPALVALREELAGDGIDVVAVNLGDPADQVRDFVAANGLQELPVAMDDKKASASWYVNALPVTYVIDPKGRIAYAALGPRDWGDASIASALRSLKTSD